MDLDKMIAGLTHSGIASGVAGGLAGGALSGALMSKKGKKHAKTLLQVGGLAALGGLAWKAYQGYQKRGGENAAGGRASAPIGSPLATPAWSGLRESDFAIESSEPEEGSRGLLMVRAMIAAASADGHIDGAEQTRIFERVETLGLTADEKALLFDEIRQPLSLDRLVAEVGDPETAVEVYAASLYAVDEHLPQGRAYLEALSSRLSIPPTLVTQIESQLSAQLARAAA